MTTFIVLAIIGGLAYLFIGRKKTVLPTGIVLEDIIDLKDLEHIQFYVRLNTEQQIHFRNDLLDFFNRVRITGIDTELTRMDRLLIAASAVIPVFYFPQWQYYELEEVLLFDSAINLEFETGKEDSNILGMVGTGKMEGKMILSRPSLEEGFFNKTDKFNTGIHEFIHLIDKEDGRIDGLPKVLMDKQYAIPWLQMIRAKIEDIKRGNSDIDEYGATNLSEFLAVSGEYFFERPDLLKVKHPELYRMMDLMFGGKIST